MTVRKQLSGWDAGGQEVDWPTAKGRPKETIVVELPSGAQGVYRLHEASDPVAQFDGVAPTGSTATITLT